MRWDNSEGDCCHWILNHDPLNTVESAGEPPDSWTTLTEIFMFWHSILQCPVERVSLSVAEKIPLCYEPAALPCHTSSISRETPSQVQELCDPWDKGCREDNMSNYSVDCNVWLSLFSGKEKKKEKRRVPWSKWGGDSSMKWSSTSQGSTMKPIKSLCQMTLQLQTTTSCR